MPLLPSRVLLFAPLTRNQNLLFEARKCENAYFFGKNTPFNVRETITYLFLDSSNRTKASQLIFVVGRRRTSRKYVSFL